MLIPDRIQQIPRRRWEDLATPETIRGVSEQCRLGSATCELRPIQAVGLLELHWLGGLFMLARVGAGKTLVAGLAAHVLGAKRPLMLMPANGGGLKKTRRELEGYRNDGWRIVMPELRTYQWLGQPQHADALIADTGLRPDLIVCDESQWLKSVWRDQGQIAAVAVRIAEYLTRFPGTKCVFLTGSATSDGDVRDFIHLVAWALRARAPVPLHPIEQRQWCDALSGAGAPGLLLGAESAEDAEERFAERFSSAPGVIISNDRFDGPLSIAPWVITPTQQMADHFARLRDCHLAPDGYMLGDQFQTYRVARQFANGYCTVHDPRPPEEFLDARRAVATRVREGIIRGEWDSEGQAVRQWPASEAGVLAHWQDWKARFPLNTRFMLLDPTPAQFAAAWARHAPGLVWVHGKDWGAYLAAQAGIPYYGLGSKGAIMNETGERSCVASIRAISQAYNLQGPRSKRTHFHRNLVTYWPGSALDVEQMMGRTHREEQTEPVTVEWTARCAEDLGAWFASRTAASKITALTRGQPQKILTATAITHPAEPDPQTHAAWRATAVDAVDAELEDE